MRYDYSMCTSGTNRENYRMPLLRQHSRGVMEYARNTYAVAYEWYPFYSHTDGFIKLYSLDHSQWDGNRIIIK